MGGGGRKEAKSEEKIIHHPISYDVGLPLVYNLILVPREFPTKILLAISAHQHMP
jgi:hypothetical protein